MSYIYLSKNWKNNRYPFGECFTDKVSSYISLSITTLSSRFTLQLFGTSSIFKRLKTHSCVFSKYRKILSENASILHKRKTLTYQI